MKLKVVIFDDNSSVLEAMSYFVKKRGHEVLGYSNPTLCPLYTNPTCICSKKNPCADILITDNQMPTMNGLEFILQQAARGCKGVIKNKAVMSGAWSQDELRLAESLGCAVFHKPVDVGKLVIWLEEREASILRERTDSSEK